MQSGYSPPPASAVFVLAVLCLLLYFYGTHKKRNFPPGPPRLPIIGNIHQLTSRLWPLMHLMTDWRKIYGPLIYLSVLGQPIVILGTHKVVKDLLDRRTAVYSGRPKNIVGELMTKDYVFALSESHSSKLYKRMHQVAHDAVGIRVYRDYFPVQELESAILVSSLLASPDDFVGHLKRTANSAMISILYGGPPILDPRDPLILLVDSFAEGITLAALPGSYFVEFLPWMMHLPRWMCPWRVKAENWYIHSFNGLRNLLKDVSHREKSGAQAPCVASRLLKDVSQGKICEEEAVWTAGTIYAAGVETTSGQMKWFILAMVLHPSVQRIAQAELDRIVGRDRLPSFNDFLQLPFICAIVKELLRWRPILPVALVWKGMIPTKATTYPKEAFVYQTFVILMRRHFEGCARSCSLECRHIVCSSRSRRYSGRLIFFRLLGRNIVDANASESRGITAPPEPFECRYLPRFKDIHGIVAERRARGI